MDRLSSKRVGIGHRLLSLSCLPLAFSLLVLLLLYSLPTGPTPPPFHDPCSGRYIYLHDLPPRFNSDLLCNCRDLSQWTDMCPFISNSGLGPRLDRKNGSWFNTNQFTLEVIFHNRMKSYRCLTSDSSLAAAVFVPFYAGLEITKHLWGAHNTSVRDAAALDLVRWLRSRPEWAVMGGMDHFLVAGRIAWDFRRLTDDDVGDGSAAGWGSNFLFLPEAKNMTALVIEASPWHANDVAIPYPTYFHPSTKREIVEWQERMLTARRPWLFSFAGAPRPNMTGSIRGILMDQCRRSTKCGLLDCYLGNESECHSPKSVMSLFEKSVFCLQPPGDSFTRRSAFDSMVAGCIPVFFHPGSAYVQYKWHLPRNYKEYSVFVEEEEVREGRVRVEEVLMGYGEEEVRRMREEVVRMIPRVVYGRREVEGVRDAFDVAVEGVVERVGRRRRRFRGGEEEEEDWEEKDNWKEGLVGRGEKHEWDHFFESNR